MYELGYGVTEVQLVYWMVVHNFFDERLMCELFCEMFRSEPELLYFDCTSFYL